MKSRSGSKPSTRSWTRRAPPVPAQILKALTARARLAGVDVPVQLNTPYVNTIRVEEEERLPRRSADRAPHQEPHPLERHGHGRTARTRRTPASAATFPPTPRIATPAGSRLQPFLPRQLRRPARRLRLLPGPRLARRLRPRLPRGPAYRRSTSKISATNCATSPACLPIRIPG